MRSPSTASADLVIVHADPKVKRRGPKRRETVITTGKAGAEDKTPQEVQRDSPGTGTPRSEGVSRKIFLERLGFRFDPFAHPVAEQELWLATDLTRPLEESESLAGPPFLSFFTNTGLVLETEQPGIAPLEQLRTCEIGFVFGSPGAGKTSLRFRLEAEVRLLFDGTLAVTQVFDVPPPKTLTAPELDQALTQALAVDVVIQLAEQSALLLEGSPEQRDALATVLSAGDHRARRLAARILEEDPPADFWGYGAFWPEVQRAPVRFVGRSQAAVEAFSEALQDLRLTQPGSPWRVARQAARALGFNRVLLLVDGIDTFVRSPGAMFALIDPLLARVAELNREQVSLVFFLPLELRSRIEAYLRDIPAGKPIRRVEASIAWTPWALHNLLRIRFQSAGPVRWSGLEDWAGPELAGRLAEAAIGACHGSPRRLLQIVSGLIDARRTRAGARDDILMTIVDWDRMAADWGHEAPAPPRWAEIGDIRHGPKVLDDA